MARFTVADLNAMAEMAAMQMTAEQCSTFAAFAARIGGRYSLRNRFLMWLQNPQATQVAGFHDWPKQGRKVKTDGSAKGKGLAILAPLTRTPNTKPDSADATAAGDGERRVFGMRVSYVHDIAFTDPLEEAGTETTSTSADGGIVHAPGAAPSSEEITALLDSLRTSADVRQGIEGVGEAA